MRKSTLIISSILTGLVLAILVMLVSTYRKVVEEAVPAADTATQVQEQVQPEQQAAPSSQNLADAPTSGNVRIYDAAAEAAKVLGRNDVYITEYAQLNGNDVYLVTFLSGDLVYVSLDGQVVSTSKQDAINPYQPTSHR